MAFELEVRYGTLPASLKERWEEEFLSLGFRVEIMPGFQPSAWQGGFLPIRVTEAPADFVGFALPSEAVSGFEVWFSDDAAHFRSAMGRPTTEFAMQCFGAAVLAKITGGTYFDPQSGVELPSLDAVHAARDEVLAFVKEARERELVHHAFPGWHELTNG